jgi:hypothetical protein
MDVDCPNTSTMNPEDQKSYLYLQIDIHEEVSELMKPHSGSASFSPYFKMPVQALQ